MSGKAVISQRDLVKALVIADGETVELETVSVYDQPRQSGEVLIKAVVFGSGSLSLRGLIKIENGAYLSEAFLRQNILLVGENSRAVAIPELEIETDEVKASHAAAVGKIDPEQSFYLQARGLSKKEADRLIVESFLEEALVRMEKSEADKIRQKLDMIR